MERIELLIKELDLVFGVGFTGIDRPGFDTDNGTHVTEPNMSECGRFPVDPCDEYGEYKVLRWIKESEWAYCKQVATECGSNADWSAAAFHVGPGSEPNMHNGDVYVTSDEPDGRDFHYCIVRRWTKGRTTKRKYEPCGSVTTERISDWPDLMSALVHARRFVAMLRLGETVHHS